MRYVRSFTLQDLCLESIIQHLNVYILHKDSIPQRHISFLLRLFSKECFSKYASSHRQTEECLLWFLSAPNKTVFLPRITHNIMERLQILGSAITSLTLQKTLATEDALNSVIRCVPNLLYLDLSTTNCSDNTLLCIKEMCPDLADLNLQYCNVTDDGMTNLCGNRLSLKNLNILDTAVEYFGLLYIIRGMPSLQCLTYDNLAEAFDDLFAPNKYSCTQKNIKYNLTELIYARRDFDKNPMRVISTWTVLCPNVEKVRILFPVSHGVLEMCSRFLHLKEFEFKAKNFIYYDDDDFDGGGGFVLDPLVPLLCIANNLTTLKLAYVRISPVNLIEGFKNVKDLHLNKVTFIDFDEDEIISKNTNLDSLTIKNLQLDMNGVAYKFIVLLISLSQNVTELIISKMAYFPDDLVDIILNSMKNLTSIKFSLIQTKLAPSFFKFFEIPTVKRVYTDNCTHPFSGPIHFSTDSSTLSWRDLYAIYDAIERDEGEDYHAYDYDQDVDYDLDEDEDSASYSNSDSDDDKYYKYGYNAGF